MPAEPDQSTDQCHPMVGAQARDRAARQTSLSAGLIEYQQTEMSIKRALIPLLAQPRGPPILCILDDRDLKPIAKSQTCAGGCGTTLTPRHLPLLAKERDYEVFGWGTFETRVVAMLQPRSLLPRCHFACCTPGAAPLINWVRMSMTVHNGSPHNMLACLGRTGYQDPRRERPPPRPAESRLTLQEWAEQLPP